MAQEVPAVQHGALEHLRVAIRPFSSKQAAQERSKSEAGERDCRRQRIAKPQPSTWRAPAEHVAALRGARVGRILSGTGRYQALPLSGEAGSERTVPYAEHQRVLAEVRRLERQRTQLQGALRAALRLVDVLRRQVAHVQASGVLPLTQAHLAGLAKAPSR